MLRKISLRIIRQTRRYNPQIFSPIVYNLLVYIKNLKIRHGVYSEVLAKQWKNGIADAKVIFYNSEFFEKLYDAETGLYLEGSDYLYGIFSDEIKQGKLVQNEI